MKALLSAVLFVVGATSFSHAANDTGRQILERLFRPGGATRIALAPDGRHLAFTVSAVGSGNESLKLGIVDLDGAKGMTVLPIGDQSDRSLPQRSLAASSEWVSRMHSLHWINARQIIYAREVLHYSDLRIVDADGKRDRLLVDRYEVAYNPEAYKTKPGAWAGTSRNPWFVGLSPEDPNILVIDGRYDGLPVSTSRFLYDLTRRRLRPLSDGIEGRIIHDWTGHARLRETPRELPTGAQRYEIKQPGAGAKWDDFDTWLGAQAGVTFARQDRGYFGARSIPLGFDRKADLLYYASNAHRDTYGIYALDLRTKKRTSFAMEDARLDLMDIAKKGANSPLIFDRNQKLAGVRVPGVPSRTRWLEPKLADMQKQLDAKFPARSVEILDWDLAIRRVAAVVSGPGDPGRFIVFEEGSGRVTAIAERTPWLPSAALNPAAAFEFNSPQGVRLSGTVTRPRDPLVKNPPLVVLCPDMPGWREPGGFDRQAQALAFCGFIVMKVDYRGVSGFGRSHREAAKGGFDRVPIEDVRTAMDWLARQMPFDRKRVALVGEGFGGYLALRAMELYPGEFRAAVTFDAPTDLALWTGSGEENLSAGGRLVDAEVAARREFFGLDKAKLEEISLLPRLDAVTGRVFILQRPGDRPGKQGKEIVRRLRANGRTAEYGEIAADKIVDAGGTQAIAKVMYYSYPHENGDMNLFMKAESSDINGQTASWTYRNSPDVHQRINEFLTANLYDFDVTIGPTRILEGNEAISTPEAGRN